jgi:peptidoglycan hydrolase-like protein with peptidoglycan-binding domain/phosphodiesterase/alkaline phosphatase D-like protein
VSAYDAAGNTSAQSTSASATTQTPPDTTAPILSSIVAGSLTQTSATITWTTNESSDTQVEYGQTVSYGNTTVLNSSLVTSHSQTLSSLSAGTTYHYRVKSKDAAGNLSTSLDYSFTTVAAPDTTAPNAVANLAVTAGSITQTSAGFTWTSPSDLPSGGTVASYDIRYSTSVITTSNWSTRTQVTGEPTPATPGASQSYTIAGLTAGRVYYVAIKSTDVAGNIANLSNVATLTTTAPADTTPPVISAITAGSITQNGAVVTWTTNESSDTQVEYGQTVSYGNTTVLNSSLVTSHSQTLSSLSAGTTYHYRVKSKDAAGNVAQSGDNTFTTLLAPDTTAPTAPNAPSATAISQTAINLAWTASADPFIAGQINSGVKEYRIERCQGTGCSSFTQITTVTTDTAYTNTSLTASTAYSYRFRSQDNAGNFSNYSGIVTAITQTIPPPVDTTPPVITAIDVSGTASDAEVSWTTNELATSRIDYGTNDSSLTQVVDSATLTASHTLSLTGLKRRTTYYYKITSSDASGNTKISTVGSFKTGNGKTSPITGLQAASGSIVLSWDALEDPLAIKVEIYRETSGYPNNTQPSALISTITDVSQTTYRDNNVTNDTTYYYTLYAVDDLGIYSDPSNISFTPKAPAPYVPPAGGGGGGGGGGSPISTVSGTPTNVTIIGAPNQIILNWKNPTDQNFVRTRVIRKAGGSPVSPTDGTIVYEDVKSEFTDRINLLPNTQYFYGVFSLSKTLETSPMVIVSAKLGDVTEDKAVQLLSVIATQPATSQTIEGTNNCSSSAGLVLSLPRNLVYGMSGVDVTSLQKALTSLGYTVTATGTYDTPTQIAVQKFQCVKMKICSGTYLTNGYGRTGPGTISALKSAYEKPGVTCAASSATATIPSPTNLTRTLTVGMTGNDIKLIQTKLQLLGYFPKAETATGYFGALTQKALRDFQCAKMQICSGTSATTGWGQVGKMTWTTLNK